jgi:hypothetical protein
VVVGEEVVGLGAAYVDGEIEAHVGLLYYFLSAARGEAAWQRGGELI